MYLYKSNEKMKTTYFFGNIFYIFFTRFKPNKDQNAFTLKHVFDRRTLSGDRCSKDSVQRNRKDL